MSKPQKMPSGKSAGQHLSSDPRPDPQLPTPIIPTERLLTAAEFHRLAEVPPEIEWFANIRNRSTRRAYENAIRDFMQFTGIVRPEEFRIVTRGRQVRTGFRQLMPSSR